RLPRAQRETEREQTLLRRVALVEVLVAEIPLVQLVAHAERRAHVLQVVLHDHAAVLGQYRVERVRGLEVRQVSPCTEDTERAQIAAMLMRHDVVRIVRTCALEQISADNLPREQTASDNAVRAVWFLG